jgi:translocation and assembly module TamB
VAGLLKPEQLVLGSTAINLPAGSVRIDYLEKTGTAWRSKGQAAGVPVNYLAQLSDAWRDNVRSSMTIGADWNLNLQATTRALAGGVHVFREQGDLTITGADLPQALGLRTLDARADVADGTLRVQLNVDGSRAGQAKLDGSALLRDGRLADDSTFTVSGSANMGSLAWLAPLAGQPGLEIDGTLKAAISGSGTIAAPQLNGDISGDKLSVNWLDQGIKLRNGQLQARVTGDQLQLQKLTFDGRKAAPGGWLDTLRRQRGHHAAQAQRRQTGSAVAPGPHPGAERPKHADARRQALPARWQIPRRPRQHRTGGCRYANAERRRGHRRQNQTCHQSAAGHAAEYRCRGRSR